MSTIVEYTDAIPPQNARSPLPGFILVAFENQGKRDLSHTQNGDRLRRQAASEPFRRTVSTALVRMFRAGYPASTISSTNAR